MELTLALTHACNLDCSYCYAGEKSPKTMSEEVVVKALDLAFAHPSPSLRVMPFGGEPLLVPDLLTFVAEQTRLRSRQTGKPAHLGLTTNATLLDDGALDLLERFGFLVTVSIDGGPQAHNSARKFPDGRGSYEQVASGFQRARQRLGHVACVSVVHPENVDLLPDSFEALRALGARQQSFNLDFDARWDDELLARYELALTALADRVLEAYRAGEDFSVQPFHNKIISRLKGGFSESDKCDFGCAEIAVAPSGNLYPCDRLIGADGPDQADIRIGHVDRGVDTVRVDDLKKPKDTPKADCETCALASRCMWWCGCVNRALTGRVDGVDPVLCQVEQMKIRQADRIATTLFQENNPAFIGRYYLAASAEKRPDCDKLT